MMPPPILLASASPRRSELQASFWARATPRKLSRKQSATAAQSSVSGDQRSPGPSNSAGGAVARTGRPGDETGTSPSVVAEAWTV